MNGHMPAADRLMIRLAAEGVPVLAIARALQAASELVDLRLARAVREGELVSAPADDWPGNARVPTNEPLPVAEIGKAVDGLVTLGLTRQESLFAAALLVCGRVTNPQAHALMCGPGTTSKVVTVVAFRVRQTLRPHGVAIINLWGTGYRMGAADQARLRAAIVKAEAAINGDDPGAATAT